MTLEPCPFCGGDARVTYSDRGEVWQVRCNNWTGDAGSKSCMGGGAYAHTEAEAIAAWNRRTQPSAGEVVAWQWRQARGHLWRDVEPLPNGMYDLAWYQARPENYVLRPLYATPPDQSRVERLEATEAALIWAMDEIDILSNKLCQFGYPQGMSILDRRNQIDNYRKAVDARRQALHGDRP